MVQLNAVCKVLDFTSQSLCESLPQCLEKHAEQMCVHAPDPKEVEKNYCGMTRTYWGGKRMCCFLFLTTYVPFDNKNRILEDWSCCLVA